MQLTTNFTSEEFEHSAKAIDFGIDNHLPAELIPAAVALCENVLQPLRERFGPITISSGYSSQELNKAVGGVKTSQHLTAEAADIVPVQAELTEVYLYIVEELEFDQCFFEQNSKGAKWIHVSYSLTNNRRVYGKLNPK